MHRCVCLLCVVCRHIGLLLYLNGFSDLSLACQIGLTILFVWRINWVLSRHQQPLAGSILGPQIFTKSPDKLVRNVVVRDGVVLVVCFFFL